MKILFQNTDIPRKAAHSKMQSCWNSERDGFIRELRGGFAESAALMTTQSCVKVEHAQTTGATFIL